ncbi:MAG: DUF362 domain-containing protein [Nitrososphaerales archaeon]
MKIGRRKLIALSALGVVGALATAYFTVMSIRKMKVNTEAVKPAEVYLVKTNDRVNGVKRLLAKSDLAEYKGKRVFLKANFNSSDPYPASTHPDTLRTIVNSLRSVEVKEVVLGERSGMGNTRDVLNKVGVFNISAESGLKIEVLNENPLDKWVKIEPNGTHWLNGFYLPKTLLESDKVIQTCCLKTHRFGGHFTMSLKNSVGLVAKSVPGELYDYMVELHTSPYQRLMIAEINAFYNTDFIILDALSGFATGGPESGKLINPNLIIAGKDRVAVDAVGVAVLRRFGSTSEVMRGRIFELEQIKRAAEIGVGVNAAKDIKLRPLDEESREDAEQIEEILQQQG